MKFKRDVPFVIAKIIKYINNALMPEQVKYNWESINSK
jgi:hypothetical protein